MLKKWSEYLLGDLFTLKHGFAFKGEHFVSEGNYLLMTPGNFLSEGGLKYNGSKEKFYSGKFPEDFILRKDDMLIVMTDLTQDASILGSTLFIPKDNYFLHNQRLGLVQNLRQDKADASYLYYILNSALFREQVKSSATGATVKHTAPERIYKCKLLFPPLPTQKRIADILSAYDELIDNNNRRMALLEQMAEQIYKEWFVRFRFPGYENAKFVKGIPEGWRPVKFSELIEEKRRNIKKEKLSPNDLYLGLEHLPIKSLVIKDKSTAATIDSDKLAFEKGEILFSKIRPYLHKVGISFFSGICSSDTIVLNPKDEKYQYYCAQIAFSKDFIDFATTTSKGTKMPRADWKVLKKFPILLPPEELLVHYQQTASTIYKQCEVLVNLNEKLLSTRDLLLPRLISGQLSVEAVEREEVAV